MKKFLEKMALPKEFIKNLRKSPSVFIQTGWEKLYKIPGGNLLFSKLAGRYIPYTGSINPIVQQISNGSAVVVMCDRRAVRNHLDSIHAIALANLGEFTTGLSLYSQLKKQEKAILIQLRVEYLKKARGDLRSHCTYHLPETFESDSDFELHADIKDQENIVVAKVFATWRVRV